MIKFPDYTKLPKQHVLYKPHKKGNSDFFDHLSLTSREKRELREQIALIQITHQLDPRTLNIPAGKQVQQLMVLEVQIAGDHYSKEWLDLLDLHLGFYAIFIVQSSDGREELVVNYKEPLSQSKDGKHFKILRSFRTSEDTVIVFEGDDLDQVYASLVKEVAKDQLIKGSDTDLKSQIEQTEQVAKLQKVANQLKKKMYAEKSMRKQMELKQEYKNILQAIDELTQ